MPKRMRPVKRKVRLGELNPGPLRAFPYSVYLARAYAVSSGKPVPVNLPLSAPNSFDLYRVQLVIARRRDRDSVSYGFRYVLLPRSPA